MDSESLMANSYSPPLRPQYTMLYFQHLARRRAKDRGKHRQVAWAFA